MDSLKETHVVTRGWFPLVFEFEKKITHKWVTFCYKELLFLDFS